MQSKLYDEEGCIDLDNQERGNNAKDNAIVKKLLKNGASFSTMCLKFGQEVYPYDDNFRAVSNYAINNDIGKIKIK